MGKRQQPGKHYWPQQQCSYASVACGGKLACECRCYTPLTISCHLGAAWGCLQVACHFMLQTGSCLPQVCLIFNSSDDDTYRTHIFCAVCASVLLKLFNFILPCHTHACMNVWCCNSCMAVNTTCEFLQNNKICSLKGSLSHFKFLDTLDLSNNQLRNLPKLAAYLAKFLFLSFLNLKVNAPGLHPALFMIVTFTDICSKVLIM